MYNVLLVYIFHNLHQFLINNDIIIIFFKHQPFIVVFLKYFIISLLLQQILLILQQNLFLLNINLYILFKKLLQLRMDLRDMVFFHPVKELLSNSFLHIQLSLINFISIFGIYNNLQFLHCLWIIIIILLLLIILIFLWLLINMSCTISF